MRRYRIFVSAHQKKLKEVRLAVMAVIMNNSTLRDFFDVFLFEDLPAKGKSPVSTYLKQVDKQEPQRETQTCLHQRHLHIFFPYNNHFPI